jgi:hypothetical protein
MIQLRITAIDLGCVAILDDGFGIFPVGDVAFGVGENDIGTHRSGARKSGDTNDDTAQNEVYCIRVAQSVE